MRAGPDIPPGATGNDGTAAKYRAPQTTEAAQAAARAAVCLFALAARAIVLALLCFYAMGAARATFRSTRCGTIAGSSRPLLKNTRFSPLLPTSSLCRDCWRSHSRALASDHCRRLPFRRQSRHCARGVRRHARRDSRLPDRTHFVRRSPRAARGPPDATPSARVSGRTASAIFSSSGSCRSSHSGWSISQPRSSE